MLFVLSSSLWSVALSLGKVCYEFVRQLMGRNNYHHLYFEIFTTRDPLLFLGAATFQAYCIGDILLSVTFKDLVYHLFCYTILSLGARRADEKDNLKLECDTEEELEWTERCGSFKLYEENES